MKNKPFGEAPLFRLAVCMMVGIVSGTSVTVDMPLWPVFVGVLLVALLLWRYEQLQSVAIALAFVMLGWVLVSRQWQKVRVDWPEGEVVYEAVVLTDPVEKPKTMAVDILLTDGHRKLKCYLYKDGRSKSLKIGDGLRIQSRIRPNSTWQRGSFDYKCYLEVHGFSGQTFVSSWKWQKTLVSLRNLSRLERTRLFFLKLRSRLLARITTDPADEDALAVVAAMVLGDKSALTQELRETYSVTGASHILALSGLHLGIIYTLLSFLIVGRRWHTVSQMLIILAIWAFVFLVGMSTSIVRSATMLTVYALLTLGHRDKMSVNTLAFTAIVILIFSPQSLYDVGFQMSYLAVFSILVLVPLSERLIPQGFLMEHRVVRWLWGLVAVSCAAQIGVAPLVAYYFGRFSTFFLLTNLIVIPAAMLILWLSPVAIVFPSLTYLLLYIVSGLNSLLTTIASMPGASIEGLHPTILQTTMTYVVIVACYLLVFRLFRGR